MPPDPLALAGMLYMLIVLHTIYTIAINQDLPLKNSGSASVNDIYLEKKVCFGATMYIHTKCFVKIWG